MTECEKRKAWEKQIAAMLNKLTPPNRQRACDQILGYASCKVSEMGGESHATTVRQPASTSDA